MFVLHAQWSVDVGELSLWAESPGPPRRVSSRGPATAAARPHPFAAQPEELAATVGPLLAAWGSVEELEVEDVTILLPSERSAPRPSPRLLPDAPLDPRPLVGLAPWSAPALRLPAAAAAALLRALDEEPAAQPQPTRPDEEPAAQPLRALPGQALRSLVEVARLSRQQVTRGGFAPTLEHERGEWVARWVPVQLGLAHDAALRALAEALGSAGLAELPWGLTAPGVDGWGQLPRPTAIRVVRSAFEALTDAGVRRRLRGSQPGQQSRPSQPGEPSEPGEPSHSNQTSPAPAGGPSDTLLDLLHAALVGPYPVVEHDDAQALEQLAARLAAWLAGAEPRTPYRTCFRVVPPGELNEDGPEGDDELWSVGFEVQHRDDPSLMLSADAVWSGDDAGSSGPALQEHLLRSLGLAARLHPPIAAALRSPAPTGFRTGVAGAWAFLRDAVPLLEQAGFSVLVPPWWGSQAARLGLRVKARSTPSTSDTSGAGGELGKGALLRFHWQVALGDETIDADELRRIAAAKAPLVRIRGRWVAVHAHEIEGALRLLERGTEEELSVVDLLRLQMGLDAAPGGLEVVDIEAGGAFGGLLAGDAKLELRSAPPTFLGTLRPYQERGLAWLAFLESCGLGACLADDMGLGKTIQVLSLLASERHRPADGEDPGATLLICPLSVVGNWASEAARFVPSLRIHVHHGPSRLRGDELTQRIEGVDLVLTTFAIATRDIETLAGRSWHRLVVDEAQAIKNRGARQSRAVRSIPATRRIALTGTPVENRLADLHAIMDLLNPRLLGSPTAFRRAFALPIERSRDPDISERLQRLVRPFILRRLKTDASIAPDLPDKVERTVPCRLTREQATLYQAVVDDLAERLAGASEMARKGAILAAMMRLKQACNHPAQLLADRSEIAGRSGKLARTEEILDEALAAGHKALIFTQFAQMGALLRTHLQARFAQEVLVLDGGTSKAARDRMVARFQGEGGPALFVLSIKAGGTGLNLTAASHVVHFDRWWNPAVENQATDRAFRIGQKRNVQVHKLVCVGTMEERIDAMIRRKQALADLVVGAGEDWVTELDMDALRGVIALSADAVEED